MGAILQQIYVQRIVQIYDLAPSFFPNGTVETFCEIFEICKSPSLETTTVKAINESITNETLTTESSNSFTLQPGEYFVPAHGAVWCGFTWRTCVSIIFIFYRF